MALVQKTTNIIFGNEGGYTSVNANDNGAVSIGRCQWHGDRAKGVLKKIVAKDKEKAIHSLPSTLYDSIMSTKGWGKKTVNDIETHALKLFLGTEHSKEVQNMQAEKDITAYINYIMKQDITDKNSISFLADIMNQGGKVGVTRIIEDTFKTYGKHAALNQFMRIALSDKVFKHYKTRRYSVYKQLTGHSYVN
jgi:hypothetical protein